MWFKLAHLLGMSVARAQMEITSSEFTEWMQYIEEYPLPDTKREYEAAHICLTLAQVMGGDKKSSLEDFRLKFESNSRRSFPSATELKTKLMAWLGMERGRNK